MASARKKKLITDDSGTAILEFTVTVTTFLLILFGTIEFGHLYYQWNAATKAVQHGARLAAVSNPVASSLTTMTGLESGALPGDPMPAFDITCSGLTASCTAGNYDNNAMGTLAYGHGNAGGCQQLSPQDALLKTGMCNYFNRIATQNVTIRYNYTGLGYAGRPGGAVATITVSLTGLTFNFYFLKDLLGLGPVTIPGLRTTVTSEDMSDVTT